MCEYDEKLGHDIMKGGFTIHDLLEDLTTMVPFLGVDVFHFRSDLDVSRGVDKYMKLYASGSVFVLQGYSACGRYVCHSNYLSKEIRKIIKMKAFI